MEAFRSLITKLWTNYKFVRISAYISGSVYGLLLFRSCYLYTYRKYYNLPSGPLSLPIAIFFGGNPVDTNQLNALRLKYGCMTSTTMGPYNCVVINEPDLVKTVYSDSRTLDIIPAVDIFSNSTKGWLERRKIIQSNLMSTLRTSFVSNSIQTFLKHVIFAEFDENIKNNKEIYLKPLFRPIAFNVVLQAMFGKQLSSLNDPFWTEWEKLRQTIMTKGMLQYLIRLIMGGDNKYSKFIQTTLTGSTLHQSFDELTKFIHTFTQNQDGNNDRDSDIKLFNDYIEEYLADKDNAKFTRNDFLSDMAMILFAAIDSTYSSLTFSLLLAAKYPNIQQEIYDELNNAFHDIDGVEFGIEGITKIPKLRAFIHESLRIYPPAPIGGIRQMLHDGFKIDARKYDGKIYDIPKKTVLAVNIYAIGQDPKNWKRDFHGAENVDMTQPNLDFWLDEDGLFSKKKNSASFFAFHYGRRNCVGQSLAIKELTIVLAMILMKYKVSCFEGKTDFQIESIYSGPVNEPNIKHIKIQHRK